MLLSDSEIGKYSYSKADQMHSISNLFYFETTLYMFRTVSSSIKFILLWNNTLHVSDSLSVHHHEMERSSISFPLTSSHRTCMTYN
jgi:hypothetical protein